MYDEDPEEESLASAFSSQCMCPDCGKLQFTGGGVNGAKKAINKFWDAAKGPGIPAKLEQKRDKLSGRTVAPRVNYIKVDHAHTEHPAKTRSMAYQSSHSCMYDQDPDEESLASAFSSQYTGVVGRTGMLKTSRKTIGAVKNSTIPAKFEQKRDEFSRQTVAPRVKYINKEHTPVEHPEIKQDMAYQSPHSWMYDQDPEEETLASAFSSQCMCPDCGGLQYTGAFFKGTRKAAKSAVGSVKNVFRPGKTVKKQETYSDENVRTAVTKNLETLITASRQDDAIRAKKTIIEYLENSIKYHWNRGSGSTKGRTQSQIEPDDYS